jgi:uncharacterized OB-fold protein
MTELPPKPVPVPDELSQGYWDAAARDALEIQRCRSCGRYHHPAVTVCSSCGAEELAYEPVSGHGTIYSYTITHDARTPAFAARAPYAVVWVELDEQPQLRLLVNMPETPLDDVKIGARVEAYFEPVSEAVKLPQFRLAR